MLENTILKNFYPILKMIELKFDYLMTYGRQRKNKKRKIRKFNHKPTIDKSGSTLKKFKFD